MRRSKSFASDSKPRKDFWVIARLDIKPIKKLCLKIISILMFHIHQQCQQLVTCKIPKGKSTTNDIYPCFFVLFMPLCSGFLASTCAFRFNDFTTFIISTRLPPFNWSCKAKNLWSPNTPLFNWPHMTTIMWGLQMTCDWPYTYITPDRTNEHATKFLSWKHGCCLSKSNRLAYIQRQLSPCCAINAVNPKMS